jgi:arabinogalactan oligomer/maltooligosaccharide transport system permease protein
MTATTALPAGRPAEHERPGAAPRRRTARRWFADTGWRHVVGVVFVVYAVFPIAYVLSASLSDGGTLTGSNQLFRSVSLENYTALAGTKFWTWTANSVQIAVITALGTVLMGAAAAYAFSRFRFTGRRAGLTTLLVVQMFPQMLAFVAIFLLLLNLGQVVPALGLNSKVALICVYLGGALGVNTFLLYGFFNTIPRELDEAAKIDGATHAQVYWTIVLRLVTPVLAVVALLSIIASFGEFVIARVLLQSESSWTLAVGLYSWVASLLEANWGLFAAGAVISTVPVLALFLFLQKYIVGGLTAGSVKG